MSLTVGRIGVSTSEGGDGFTFDGPETFTQQGRQVTVTGHIYDITRPAAVWRAKQILGLLDGDEPTVPCTFSDAPDLDGYYTVADATCDYRMIGSSSLNALVPWSITLEQVDDFRQPRLELAASYGLLDNARSITTYTSLQGFPGDSVVYLAAFDPDENGTRLVGDGSGNGVSWLSDTTTAAATSGVGAFVVPPANYYVGGCRVEHDLGSSTYRHAVGRPDFPSAGVTGSNSGVLRLQNGLVRATFTYSNATVSQWVVEWWDGSQWDASTEFAVVGFGNHGELALHSATILRNTAEMCSVRFRVLGASAGTEGLTQCDFTIRRGLRWVWVRPAGDLAPASGWRIQFNTSVASTSITGGIRRTSNNAGGNRELLASAANATADTTNGRLTASSSTTELFGVGCEVGGSGASAATRAAAAEQMEEFFAAFSESARVVKN